MKFTLSTGALALLAATTFQAAAATEGSITSFHRDQPTMEDVRLISASGNRQLDGVDEFFSFWLVSALSNDDQQWCIAAAEGTEEFGNLQLHPCDFTGTTTNQLWYLPYDDEEPKIRSVLDDSKCITMNHGENLFEGVRARLSDCENGLTTFYYDGQILVADDTSFCLTNRGPRAHPTDWIHAKTCIDRDDFYWIPIPNIQFHAKLKSGGGCAQPREGSRRVFLDQCDAELAWRISPIDFFGEAALLHSALDDSKCLRAGLGDTFEDGSRMAIVDCDPEDELQHFIYTGETIHAAENFDLCMVYRGVTPNVGVDPIIMKECDEDQEFWDVTILGYD